MSTSFRPIALPPGVVTNPTKNVNSVNYAEVNMVRWGAATQAGGGELEPVGGQSKYAYSFASRCKAIHGWYGLDGVYRTAYLCESNLYVDIGGGGVLTDITPSSGITPPTPPTTGGYNDGLYNVGPPDTYSTPRAIGADAAIDKVPDAFSLDNFGAILLAMTSPDGRLLYWDPSQGPAGLAGTTSATASWALNATTIAVPAGLTWVAAGFSVYDTTNSQLIGYVQSYSGTTLTLAAPGALHASQGATDGLTIGNVATPVQPGTGSTVPLGRCFVVTSERFVQIFGAYNDGTAGPNIGGSARRFAWCEQEDFTNWRYSDLTTQAGFMDIEPASPIVCAIATRTGTLLFTAKKAYRSRYLGSPYIYSLDELGDAACPWSPQSLATTSSMVLWMSQQGPFSYDGTSILPIQCAVWGWLNDDIDLLNVREQACAVHVANFNEFWWFFPQGLQSNPGGFNTRAVIYNYRDGWWSQARMARSAGVTASYTSHTIMANGTVSYEHEYGNIYSVDCELPWVETFDLNGLGVTSASAFQGMGAGGKLITVKQLIPDIKGAVNNLRYSLFYRNSRSVGLPELKTTPSYVRSDGYVDFRTTGRDIRLRIDLAIPAGVIVNGVASSGAVLPVTLGQHLIDAVLRSDR